MKTMLPLLFWAIVLVVVFGMVGSLKAEPMPTALNYRSIGANGQEAGLRLSEAPCTKEKVLQHIKEQFWGKFKAAVLTWGGRDWHSCYIEYTGIDQNGHETTMIFSVDEEGSQFQPIPKSMFRDDSI